MALMPVRTKCSRAGHGDVSRRGRCPASARAGCCRTPAHHARAHTAPAVEYMPHTRRAVAFWPSWHTTRCGQGTVMLGFLAANEGERCSRARLPLFFGRNIRAARRAYRTGGRLPEEAPPKTVLVGCGNCAAKWRRIRAEAHRAGGRREDLGHGRRVFGVSLDAPVWPCRAKAAVLLQSRGGDCAERWGVRISASRGKAHMPTAMRLASIVVPCLPVGSEVELL